MRNLKRALSLVMAAAMLIGMMVISASAASKDFTDSDEIQHTEAVNTMVALNVISGKEDGSYFDPTGTLTRAEMAKIVAYVMNGGVEPNIGTKLVPTYSDIDNHWAEAYIEYCTSMGIIAGDGAGKFNPEGTLTASQTAKMFLTAMGYNAEVFGLLGNDWETNTNRYANESGLYDDLGNVSVSQPISRDDACQMAYNAIQAKLMERTWSQNQTTGQITEGYELSETKTLLSERFGGKIFIGTFNANSNTVSGIRDGEIRVYGHLTTESEDDSDTATFPSDLDIANIGEQVKVIFKDGSSGTKNRPDRNDTIYGVFNTGATTVINATKADIGDQKSDDAKIKVDGVTYDTEDTVTVVTNYNGTGTGKVANDGTDDDNSTLTKALKKTNGDTIKFVCNDEGNIYAAYVVETKIAAVTAINSEKITMNNGVGTITIADNDVYEGAARGDVVTVTTLYASDVTGDNAYTIVEKAEVVSGTVEGYKTTTADGKTSYENVTLDGTAYTLKDKATLLGTIPNQTVTTIFDDDDIGETFDLYMVNGYVGAAIQTSESANNYSLVLAVRSGGVAGAAFNALELQVMDAEGTVEFITVSDDSDDKNASDYSVGDIIVYTGSADDAVVTIKGNYAAATGKYSDSTKTFNGDVTAANCVLFAETTSVTVGANQNNVSGAKYKVYNIRDLDGFEATRTVAVRDSNDRVVAVFADLPSTPAGASSNTVYGIVSAANGRVKIGDNYYYQYVVAANAEDSYTLNMNDNDIIAKGDLVSFEPVSDNAYGNTDVTVIDDGAVYVKEYSESDGTLTYFAAKEGAAGDYEGVASTQKTLALDDDCAIVYVDADGDAAGSEIGINPFDGVTGYKNAAIVTKEVDGENIIVAIFVETSNECSILATGDALISPSITDVTDRLDRDGNVEIVGAVPAGNLVSNFDTVEVTLTDAAVSGNTLVGGGVTVSGTLTLGATGTLEAVQVTVPSSGIVKTETGSTLKVLAISLSNGARIEGDLGFVARADMYIDFDNQTINGDISFSGGLIEALTAANGAGLGDWYAV